MVGKGASDVGVLPIYGDIAFALPLGYLGVAVLDFLKGAYLVLPHLLLKREKKKAKLFVFDFAHIFRSFWEKIETLKSGVFFANSV